MQDFIDFGLRHWELSLAFILILVYWLVSEYLEHRGGHGVSPLQLIHLMNREHGVVVDLRDADHFEAGHIMGALSFPEKDLMANLNKLKKYQSKPVILVDDVYTSGATTDACVATLLRAGASGVTIFCWARVLPEALEARLPA